MAEAVKLPPGMVLDPQPGLPPGMVLDQPAGLPPGMTLDPLPPLKAPETPAAAPDATWGIETTGRVRSPEQMMKGGALGLAKLGVDIAELPSKALVGTMAGLETVTGAGVYLWDRLYNGGPLSATAFEDGLKTGFWHQTYEGLTAQSEQRKAALEELAGDIGDPVTFKLGPLGEMKVQPWEQVGMLFGPAAFTSVTRAGALGKLLEGTRAEGALARLAARPGVARTREAVGDLAGLIAHPGGLAEAEAVPGFLGPGQLTVAHVPGKGERLVETVPPLLAEVGKSAAAGARFSMAFTLPDLVAQTSYQGVIQKALETSYAGTLGAAMGAGVHGSVAAYAGVVRLARAATWRGLGAIGELLPEARYGKGLSEELLEIYRAEAVKGEAVRRANLDAWAEKNKVPVQDFESWKILNPGGDRMAYDAAVSRGTVVNPDSPLDNPQYASEVAKLVEQGRMGAGALKAERDRMAAEDEHAMKLATEAVATRQVLESHIQEGDAVLQATMSSLRRIREEVALARAEAGENINDYLIRPEEPVRTEGAVPPGRPVGRPRDPVDMADPDSEETLRLKDEQYRAFENERVVARTDPDHIVRPFMPLPLLNDRVAEAMRLSMVDRVKRTGPQKADEQGIATLNISEPGDQAEQILLIADGGKAAAIFDNATKVVGQIVRLHPAGERTSWDVHSPVNKLLARLSELGVERTALEAWTRAGAKMVRRRMPQADELSLILGLRGLEEMMARDGDVWFLPGDTRGGKALTPEGIGKGIEDLRTGTYHTPEGDAVLAYLRRLRREHGERAGRAAAEEAGSGAGAGAAAEAGRGAGRGGETGAGRGGGAGGTQPRLFPEGLTVRQRTLYDLLAQYAEVTGRTAGTASQRAERLIQLHDDLLKGLPGATTGLDRVFEGTRRGIAHFWERHDRLASRLERIEGDLAAAAQVIDERGYGIGGWKLGQDVPARFRHAIETPEGKIEVTPVVESWIARRYEADTVMEIYRRITALRQAKATTPPSDSVSTRSRWQSLSDTARTLTENLGRVSELVTERPAVDPKAAEYVFGDLLGPTSQSAGYRFKQFVAGALEDARKALSPMALEEETDMILQLAERLAKDPTSARQFFRKVGLDTRGLDRAMASNDPESVATALASLQRKVPRTEMLTRARALGIESKVFTTFGEAFAGLHAIETEGAASVRDAVTKAMPTRQERELASVLVDEQGLERRLKRVVDRVNEERDRAHKPPLDEGKVNELREKLYSKMRMTEAGRAAIGFVRQHLDEVWRQATEAGVISPADFLSDFLPRQYSEKEAPAVMRFLEERKMLDRPNAHSLHRVFETLLDAQEAGFRPRTLDVADLLADYYASISRSILKQELVRGLMQVAPHQFRDVGIETAAPAGWKELSDVYLAARNPVTGTKTVVQEDLGRLLNNLLSPSWWRQGGVRRKVIDWNTWFKHAVLTLDVYHMKQLTQAAFAEGVLVAPESLRDAWRALTDNLHPDHPLVQALQRAGLSAYGGDYVPFRDYHNLLANHPAVKLFEAATRRFNEAAWGHYVPALKILLATELYQRQALLHPEVSPEEIMRGVAAHVNKVAGGRSWLETGRAKTFDETMRMALLAPDWVLSRFRLAIGGVTGAAKGVLGVTNELHPWRDRMHELDLDFWVNGDVQKDGRSFVSGYLIQGMVFTAFWNAVTSKLFPGTERDKRLDGLGWFFRIAVPMKDKWGRNLIVSFMPNVDYMVEALEDSRRFVRARLSPAARATTEFLGTSDFTGRSTGTLFGGENVLNFAANLLAPLPMPVNPAWRILTAKAGQEGLEGTRAAFRLVGFHSRTNYPYALRDEMEALEASKLRLERFRAAAGRVPGGSVLFNLAADRQNRKVDEWMREAQKEPDLVRHLKRDVIYRLRVRRAG